MTMNTTNPDPSTEASTVERRRLIVLAAVVFAVGLVMGLPSLRGDFLSGDDVHLVLNHVLVNHPSVAHAFELICIVHRDLYQPVPMLSFSLDFVIINLVGLTPFAEGPAAGAWVFHLTNVLIHAFNGVLVFWLFTRLHDRRAVAVVAALLFALHPFAAEVVGWLNGRMMLLATLFSLASLIAMDAHLLRARWRTGILAQVFVVLAMASKVRVGLPVLMLLLPLFRRRWPDRRWWVAWVVTAVLTAGFTILNVITTSYSEMFEGAAEELQGSRIARTVLVLAWYFQHYVVPINMSPWHPPESLVNWSHPAMPLAILTLLIAAAVACTWRWTRIGLLGLLWFGATVASMLPLMPARDVMAADRYVYLPNVGLHWIWAALLVHAVYWAARRLGKPRIVPLCAGLGVAAAVAVLPYTWHVLSSYKSNLDKASRIAAVYPDEPGVWEDIGWAYYRRGDFAQAITAVRPDLEKHPDEMACEAYHLIGMAQVRLGRVEEGIATLYKAVQADPDYGKCYSRLGQVYYELDRYEEAEKNYLRAIEIMPDYLPAVQALGHVYRKLGRNDEAEQQYRRGLEINDFDPVSTTVLAELEMERGDCPSAIQRFEQLLSWMPENTVARTNLGVCYARTGRIPEAMNAYRRALERDPSTVTAAINLALLEAQKGNDSEAVALMQRAAGYNPTDRQLLVAGHDLFAGMGRLRDAARLWTGAMAHEPHAPDLLAWYAWTSALAGQWAPARKAAAAALGVSEGPTTQLAGPQPGPHPQSLALAALVLAELAADDPDAAENHLNRLLDSLPDPPDAPQRLRRAIARIGEKTPDSPWPYYFAARLLLADGQTDAARNGLEEFIRRCPDPAWKQRATDLLPSTQ